MREFYQDNKETLKIVVSIVAIFAGLIVMIMGHPLIGLVVLSVGLILFSSTLARILHSGGYTGEGVVTNMGGMGRQQSELTKDPNAGAVSETNSDIWDQMTDDK